MPPRAWWLSRRYAPISDCLHSGVVSRACSAEATGFGAAAERFERRQAIKQVVDDRAKPGHDTGDACVSTLLAKLRPGFLRGLQAALGDLRLHRFLQLLERAYL